MNPLWVILTIVGVIFHFFVTLRRVKVHPGDADGTGSKRYGEDD